MLGLPERTEFNKRIPKQKFYENIGSMRSMQLRLIEESKIHCAREHFKAISDNNVVYDVVDSYQTLLEKVMR